MGFYEQRAAAALRLITKYGVSATIRRVTKGDYNAATGSRSEATVLEYPCKAIVEEYELKEVDGSIIKLEDRKIIVAAQGLAIRPDSGDMVVMSATTLQIVKNWPTSPGGVDIIHTLQVRR